MKEDKKNDHNIRNNRYVTQRSAILAINVAIKCLLKGYLQKPWKIGEVE